MITADAGRFADAINGKKFAISLANSMVHGEPSFILAQSIYRQGRELMIYSEPMVSSVSTEYSVRVCYLSDP